MDQTTPCQTPTERMRPPLTAVMRTWRLAAMAIFVTPLTVHAAAYQDHASIRLAAETFAVTTARTLAPASATVQAEVSAIDPRLSLPACPMALEAFSPPGYRPAGRVSVGIRCPAEAGWSLYVPVRLEIRTEVVVLAAPLSRGETLTARHLAMEPRDVAQLSGGYLTRIEDAEDMLLRRPLAVGAVLTGNTLERPKVIQRGQRVRLISISGGFSVSAEGEAMADAARGDRLRVRNLTSRKVVEGVVDESGGVVVGGSA